MAIALLSIALQAVALRFLVLRCFTVYPGLSIYGLSLYEVSHAIALQAVDSFCNEQERSGMKSHASKTHLAKLCIEPRDARIAQCTKLLAEKHDPASKGACHCSIHYTNIL